MIEGALVAPVLATILVGLVYLQRSYQSALDGGDTVRSCAWAYAASGCSEAFRPPARCRLGVGSTMKREALDGFLFGAERSTQQAVESFDDDSGGTLDGILEALDGLGDVAVALMGMRDEVHAVASYEVDRPQPVWAEQGSCRRQLHNHV